jgi:hypothetical protein
MMTATFPRHFLRLLDTPDGPRLRLTYAQAYEPGKVGPRSKTGNAKCSDAVSAWKTGRATPETHQQLAQCRAEAGGQRAVAAQRNAGQEGRAQHLEHRLKSGQPLTAKARQAQAQQLATQRQQARQAPLSEEEFQGRLRAITERVRKQNRIYPVGRTPQSRVRFGDQIKKALREDPEHQALMQRRERDLATLARPKPAATPPPAPAVVATKARPDRETRLNLLINQAGGLVRRRESQGQLAQADVIRARRSRLREALGGANEEKSLKLEAQRAARSFSFGLHDQGSGEQGDLFEVERKVGAEARDLPGQTNIMDRHGTFETGTLSEFRRIKEQAAALARADKAKGVAEGGSRDPYEVRRRHHEVTAAKVHAERLSENEFVELMEGEGRRGMTVRAARDLGEQVLGSKLKAEVALPPTRNPDMEILEAEKVYRLIHRKAMADRPAMKLPERPDRLVKMGDQAVPIPTPASLKEQAQQNRLLTTMTGEGRSKIAAHLKAVRAASRAAGIDPALHTSHQPGTVTELNTDLIHFDPQRFQYKLDQTDLKTGSVGSLAGVRKWDPELAGTVSVWKDPKDGKVYVINGHNRLDLAKKMGVDRVAVRFLKAGDAQEARGKGALTNIAEGRGSVIDAAKFFRDSRIRSKADLENLGIPLGEAKARQGLELAGLHDNLFRRVIDGTLTPARGAIIGGVGLSDDQQMKVAMLADSKRHGGREITDTHLREIVDEVRHAPTQVKSGGGGLFGDDPEAQSLALHRTALVSHVKERLGREKRLFGTVSRQRAASELTRVGNVINREESGKVSQAAAEALDTFDRLKRSTGPVSAAINRATERLATARGPSDRKAIHDQLYEEILGAVQHAHRLSA